MTRLEFHGLTQPKFASPSMWCALVVSNSGNQTAESRITHRIWLPGGKNPRIITEQLLCATVKHQAELRSSERAVWTIVFDNQPMDSLNISPPCHPDERKLGRGYSSPPPHTHTFLLCTHPHRTGLNFEKQTNKVQKANTQTKCRRPQLSRMSQLPPPSRNPSPSRSPPKRMTRGLATAGR